MRLPPSEPARTVDLPVASIVTMVGKGMTAREILAVFPKLTLEDVRGALLRAADVVVEPDAALAEGGAVDDLLARARRNSDLDDEAAMELAIEETRAVRRGRAGREGE